MLAEFLRKIRLQHHIEGKWIIQNQTIAVTVLRNVPEPLQITLTDTSLCDILFPKTDAAFLDIHQTA